MAFFDDVDDDEVTCISVSVRMLDFDEVFKNIKKEVVQVKEVSIYFKKNKVIEEEDFIKKVPFKDSILNFKNDRINLHGSIQKINLP